MMKRTIREYDVKHTGDEDDRMEILCAFEALAELLNEAGIAGVTVESVKNDLITVVIEEIDMP